MAKFDRTDHPGFEHRQDDAEYFVLKCQCIDLEGMHYCPGNQFQYGIVADDRGKSFGLFISRGRTGLSWQLTSIGARELAGILLETADRIDAEQADQAQQLLAATLGKGKPDAV